MTELERIMKGLEPEKAKWLVGLIATVMALPPEERLRYHQIYKEATKNNSAAWPAQEETVPEIASGVQG